MPNQPGDAARDRDAHAWLREKLGLVRQRFVAGFDDRLADLIALAHVVRGETGQNHDAALQSLGRGLHSIAGSAPTIGLTALGAKARELEVELARAASSGRAPDPDFFDGLTALGSLARGEDV